MLANRARIVEDLPEVVEACVRLSSTTKCQVDQWQEWTILVVLTEVRDRSRNSTTQLPGTCSDTQRGGGGTIVRVEDSRRMIVVSGWYQSATAAIREAVANSGVLDSR